GAGREGTFRPGEHDRPDPGVVVEGLRRRDDLDRGRRAQRVEGLGAVHGDPPYPSALLDEDGRVVGHRFPSWVPASRMVRMMPEKSRWAPSPSAYCRYISRARRPMRVSTTTRSIDCSARPRPLAMRAPAKPGS